METLSEPGRAPGFNRRALVPNFDPLKTAGAAALAPDGALGISRAILVKEVLRWRNAFNEVTIRIADDLFACAERSGFYYDPFPKGAEPESVVLELEFRGQPARVRVELTAWGTVTVSDPAAREKALEFLAKRGLLATDAPGTSRPQ